MSVITHHRHTSDQQEFDSQPGPTVRVAHGRWRWHLVVLTLLISAGALAWLAKGHGVVTRVIRVVNPDYRVPSYPPKVMTTFPGDGEEGTAVATLVNADLRVARCGIDINSLNADSVFLFRTGDQKPVAASVIWKDGHISLRPDQPLAPLTNYTFYVTAGLKDAKGRATAPFATSFTTTGQADPDIRFKRVALPNTKGIGVTALRIGPDKKLWAGSDDGRIIRYEIAADGTLGKAQTIKTLQDANSGKRLLIGFDFDRASTAANPIIWVTHSYFGFTEVPDFTGKVTRMSGPNLEIVEDAVINLPRSIKDHQTMQPSFGPDGALYFSQASNTAMGAPDSEWGMRTEHLLNACILRLDTSRFTPGQPINAKTKDCGGTYDPYAPSAPLTIYATGVRLGYDLVWHSNGHLYVPTNGSDKDGNVPGTKDAPALHDVPIAEDDWLFRVEQGKYYGHPNPVQKHYVLNGGNPTEKWDFAEIVQYPVGTKPDPNWQPAAWDLGRHISANGAIEYTSARFGGKLKGKLIICRYNWGSDLIAIGLDADGNVCSAESGFVGTTHLQSPLDVIEDPTNGNLYVSEYGAQRITLLRAVSEK